MAKVLSTRRQIACIRYMLNRKYPKIGFKLYKGSREGTDGSLFNDVVIVVEFNAKQSGDVTRKDVADYLKRFANIPASEDSQGVLRTYWMNADGYVTLARLRLSSLGGGTKLVDKEVAPTKGGPYTLERFPINSYKVIDSSKPVKRPYEVYEYD